MNNMNDKDIGMICLNAIRNDAFENGVRQGTAAGMKIGSDRMMDALDKACEVTKVVHSGFATYVYFEDGEFEKVTYDPSFGYAYDGEKAIMAALLKHLTGSRYLHALKKFEGRGEAIINGDVPVAYSLEGKLNLSRSMVERLRAPVFDDEDVPYESSVDYAPDGTPVNTHGETYSSEDDEFLAALSRMDDDSLDII